MEFATDVVGDDVVQRTAGEALRNTLSYAVQPGISICESVVDTRQLFAQRCCYSSHLEIVQCLLQLELASFFSP